MPATDNAVEGTSRNSVVFTVFKKQPKLAVLFFEFFSREEICLVLKTLSGLGKEAL